ncbi:MAG TPA: WD40 repeat domain-containing protein, partial [Nannocystaceae bacterium]|nr:WD40 repeat domain-containing protein [Nannocystaceae bacterium]
ADGGLVAIQRSDGIDVVDIDSGRTRALRLAPAQRLIAFAADGALEVVDQDAWRRYATNDDDPVRGRGFVKLQASATSVVGLRDDGTLVAWRDGAERRIGAHAGANRLAVARAGEVAITASDTGVLRWDLHGGASTVLFEGAVPDTVRLAIAPDGSRTALHDQAGSIVIHDANGSTPRSLRGNTKPMAQAAFSRDGNVFLTIDVDGALRELVAWDAAEGGERSRIRLHAVDVGTPHTDADGRVLVGGDELTVIDADGARESIGRCADACPLDVVAPDERAAAWSRNGELFLIDLSTMWDARVRQLSPPRTPDRRYDTSVTFAPAGDTLYWRDELGSIQTAPLVVPREARPLREWLRSTTALPLDDVLDWSRIGRAR